MDKNMKYTPPYQKKEVSVAVGACFAVGAVMYVFSLTELTWQWPLQLIMALCLCVGAYILVRYRFTAVTYEIRARENCSSASYGDDVRLLPLSMVDLAIHRAQGNRENMEFLMSLDKLKLVTAVEEGTMDSLRGRYKNMVVYCYTRDLVKRRRIAAVFEDEDSVYCAVLERDDTLSQYLFEASEKNEERHGLI